VKGSVRYRTKQFFITRLGERTRTDLGASPLERLRDVLQTFPRGEYEVCAYDVGGSPKQVYCYGTLQVWDAAHWLLYTHDGSCVATAGGEIWGEPFSQNWPGPVSPREAGSGASNDPGEGGA
jgi:hypothetical protein